MGLEAQYKETPEAQRQLIAHQKAVIEALEQRVSLLIEQMNILKRGLYGRSSERIDPDQLALFDETGLRPAVDPEPELPPVEKPRKKGHGRASFREDLPRETIELDLAPEDRICPDCDVALKPMGEDVTERGHFIPSKIVVRRYVKKKYGCPEGHVVRTAEAPPALIERCKYEPSVYAHLVTAKYCDHLPLHRLSGIFKRYGVHLPKQTMWDMLCRVDELVAQPVLKQMREEILQHLHLHADETPVVLRNEDEKGTRQSFAWLYRTLDDKVIVDFRLSRGRDGPKSFLGKYGGTMIMDGYSGYDEVVRQNGIRRAGCWSHARRKFKEALDTGSQEAIRVLAAVQRLFWIERSVLTRAKDRDLSRADIWLLRQQVRARRSSVVMDRIYREAEVLHADARTLPKSALGKAIKYLFGQETPLRLFLDDPRLPIHNNDAERDIRHLAIGRKNWLVFGSPKGGEVACRLYSLVISAKAAGIDPEAYFADILERIAVTPASRVCELTPWAWAARNPVAQAD